MTALTDFLLAQIAEDEAAADEPFWLATEYGVDSLGRQRFADRVLAECEAKRRIVEHPPYSRTDGAEDDSAHAEWLRVVRLLATIYADHPDFREEWKP